MGQLVLDRIVDELSSIDEQSAGGRQDAAELRPWARDFTKSGEPIETLLDYLFDECIPRSFTTPGPGYLAYIPGGGLYPAALADFIASATNRYTGVRAAAPLLADLEAQAMEWIREWMLFPNSARGLFTSGGSSAAFTAIVTAREKLLGTRLREGVLYLSDQIHHSLGKSARMAGILPDRQRKIPSTSSHQLDTAALEAAIEADLEAGLVPFFVASSAGTVNTGAVDEIPAVQRIAKKHGLWHHVDGAYGGFFHACPELRPLLRGLPDVDSLTLDPHKGLFLPYGTGALLVRDGTDLEHAHSEGAGYLPELSRDAFDAHQYGPELSKPNRGLAVWLCMKLYGEERLRAAILEKRTLALAAHERLAKHESLRFNGPPALSLFPFWLSWPGATQADEDRATRQLVADVNSRGRVMISGAQLADRYVARICVLCFRTDRSRLESGLADIESAATSIAQESHPPKDGG